MSCCLEDETKSPSLLVAILECPFDFWHVTCYIHGDTNRTEEVIHELRKID